MTSIKMRTNNKSVKSFGGIFPNKK